jgi:hypothetical protein
LKVENSEVEWILQGVSGDYCMDRSRNGRRIVSSIAVLVGTPFYIYCALQHVCIGGHMQHPPYSTWDYVNDAVWIICLSVAVVFSLNSNLRFRRLFFGLSVLLLILSILGGGSDIVLGPLLLIILIAISVASLTSSPKN